MIKNKKGVFAELLLTLTYLIFTAFILLTLYYYIGGAAENRLILTQIKAKTTALWLDASSGIDKNSNAQLDFEKGEHEVFDIESINKMIVKVDETTFEYYLITNKEVKIDKTEEENKIIFSIKNE
ncbi:MAG: hypothetical protein AABX59_00640 [Nanoarchaeota archaeon]